MTRLFPILVSITALCLICVSLVQLENARADIQIRHLKFDDTPVTRYLGEGAGQLVVVSHGFAGSRQMMEGISMSLARAGHSVYAFDYLGHGRHPGLLSPDITTLTGTTEDLVQQTLDVVRAAQTDAGDDRVALVGHSMATDVIIRAAERLERVNAVTAISMYSESVTPTHPQRLLILSGAQETRLRAVALSNLHQIRDAPEGVTVQQGEVQRRAAVAPYVGHVGVLWSPVTSQEIVDWLGGKGEWVAGQIAPAVTGPWIAGLLGGIFMLFWPLSRLLPKTEAQTPPSLKRAILSVLIPAPLAVLGSFLDLPLLGLSGFGALFLFFAIWGVVGLLVLGWRPGGEARPAILSGMLLLLWALAAFALALDAYGAAFLPAGPRLPLMLALVPAMLVFALADRAAVQGRHGVVRIALRIPVVLALFGAMLLNVADLGMLFTVLPVFVLFLAVYGTMAQWAAQRAGPLGPALASGVVLAWSIAGSTPLFATA